MESKYLDFPEMASGGVTKRFAVMSKDKTLLGVIKWYGAWRKYVFYPQAATLFDTGCLEDISSFIKSLMDQRRSIRTMRVTTQKLLKV